MARQVLFDAGIEATTRPTTNEDGVHPTSGSSHTEEPPSKRPAIRSNQMHRQRLSGRCDITLLGASFCLGFDWPRARLQLLIHLLDARRASSGFAFRGATLWWI